VLICLDGMCDLEHFKVYNRDLNGTLKHDERMARLLKQAGKGRWTSALP